MKSSWNNLHGLLDWHAIRGSNDVVGVRNVAKWRFDALPVLTYPGTYPNNGLSADVIGHVCSRIGIRR